MHTSKPLVSILIAAYNHERYIEETIRSLINQTYQNLELIIIDDGSLDGTYQKMLALKPECGKRFVRVDFSTQQNCGGSETGNRLIKKAEGEFIYSIASDDVAKPQAIEKLVDFMASHDDYVLAVGDDEFIDADSRVVGWDKNHRCVDIKEATYKTFGNYLRKVHKDIDFLSDEFGAYRTLIPNNYVPNGYVTRVSAQKKKEPHSADVMDDWWANLQLAKFGKMKYIDEVLFSYRIHGDNTFTKTDKMREMALKTRLYEQKLVHQKGMEHWAEIFDKYAIQKKMKFHIGKMVQFYKLIDLEYKTNILEIFGHQFVIKKKKR